MKLIDLYKQWEKSGTINNFGLCNAIPRAYDELFTLLKPTGENLKSLCAGRIYWAYDLNNYFTNESYKQMSFNPLRQNIVLFICAMNDEL